MAGVESRKEKRAADSRRHVAKESGGDGDAAAGGAGYDGEGLRHADGGGIGEVDGGQVALLAPGVFREVHQDADGDQHAADHEWIAPGGFGLFVEDQAGDADGDCADDEKPEQHVIVLEFLIAPHAYAEALGDDLDPVAGEIDEDGEQGADVQGDIEIQRLPPASRRARR